MCQWVEAVGCGFVVVGLLGWWSSERLGWVLVAVLWWVPIGVAGVVGFVAVLDAVCAVGFLFYLFWWLGVEVVVGGGGCGCDRG